jgi:hypothetical protein
MQGRLAILSTNSRRKYLMGGKEIDSQQEVDLTKLWETFPDSSIDLLLALLVLQPGRD